MLEFEVVPNSVTRYGRGARGFGVSYSLRLVVPIGSRKERYIRRLPFGLFVLVPRLCLATKWGNFTNETAYGWAKKKRLPVRNSGSVVA